MDTVARLLALLSALQARPRWSGPELAARLGVTVRTVRRDVERLRDLGYPVEADLGAAGGYRLGWGGAAVPPLMLDEDEAFAMAVALQAVAGDAVTGVAEAAGRVLAKLEPLLPPRVRPQVTAVAGAAVPLAAPVEVVDPVVLRAVSRACREREVLRIAYRDRAGRSGERRVEPYRVVDTGRRRYLVALDRRARDWRTLRLDRMAAAESTGETFVRTDPPDAAAFVQAAITAAPYRHVVRVELDAPLQAVAARVPPTVATLEAVDGATTRLTAGGDDLDWLALHVASLGMPFRVLEPPALRERLAALASRLAAAAAG